MNYYKIVKGGMVVDANYVFLQFRDKYGLIVPCEAYEAHYIQSSDQQNIYRAQWLNPLPPGAPVYETVEAVEITAAEYAEIIEALDTGEEIEYDVPEEPDDPTPVDPDEPGEDVPPEDQTPDEILTPAKMREMILRQREMIQEQSQTIQDQQFLLDMLTECVLEISEVLYE